MDYFDSTNDVTKDGLKIPFIADDEKKQKLIIPMEFDVRTKSIEEKMYIILYKVADENSTQDDGFMNIYSICYGRTEAYNDIKSKIISGIEVDVHKSKVITESKQTETETESRKYYLLPYEDWISVYAFCRMAKEYFSYDDFDITDYASEEEIEENTIDYAAHPGLLTPEQIEFYRDMNIAEERRNFFEALRNMDDEPANTDQSNVMVDDNNRQV